MEEAYYVCIIDFCVLARNRTLCSTPEGTHRYYLDALSSALYRAVVSPRCTPLLDASSSPGLPLSS